jgi:hypothetical protein
MGLPDGVIAADHGLASETAEKSDLAEFAHEHFSVRFEAHVLRCSPTTVLKRRQAEQDAEQDASDDPWAFVAPVRYRTGIDGKLRPDRRFINTERDEMICRLRADGMKIRAIAAEAGCSVGTVHRVLKADR